MIWNADDIDGCNPSVSPVNDDINEFIGEATAAAKLIVLVETPFLSKDLDFTNGRGSTSETGVIGIEERDEFIKLGDSDISDSYVISGRGSIAGATEYDGFWCKRDESNLIRFSRLQRPAAPASQTTIMAVSELLN
ncbi:hypothetical protein L1887_11678 [Cichorium endivia]|nr:hypothetical protein L1887_11678 [Cichorium endivia]